MDQFVRQVGLFDGAAPAWLAAASEPGLLGPAFDHAWPLDDASSFDDLVRAIDEAAGRSAERRVHRIEEQRR